LLCCCVAVLGAARPASAEAHYLTGDLALVAAVREAAAGGKIGGVVAAHCVRPVVVAICVEVARIHATPHYLSVAKTHGMPYFWGSPPAKEPYNLWGICGKRLAR